MDNSIVIYKSKSGYTETYARWIAEELECEVKEVSEVKIEELKLCDVIIYGGGLYAVGINGISFLKKNYSLISNKKIVVWATGANPGRNEELEEVWNYNFNSEQLNNIKTFYLRGGFDFEKLNVLDKVLMNMLKVKLKLKKERTVDEQGMLEAYNIAEYHCNKENIKSLIKYVKTL